MEGRKKGRGSASTPREVSNLSAVVAPMLPFSKFCYTHVDTHRETERDPESFHFVCQTVVSVHCE